MPPVFRAFANFDLIPKNGTVTTEINLEYIYTSPQIRCLNCVDKPMWCRHIEYAVLNRHDTQIIWELGVPDEMPLALPMFPGSDQFTNIMLEKQEEDYKIVHWIDDPRKVGSAHRGRLITGIQPGEGSQVIRAMLVEQMITDYALSGSKPICLASHHGPAAEQSWQNKTASAQYLSSYWSVYTTGQCIYCSTHDPSSDTADLVPANESGWK